MLTRDMIIQEALLFLGEVGNYNDNRSGMYKNSNIILDKVVLPSVSRDQSLLFNAITEKLNKTDLKSEIDGENVFEMPYDFMSFIKSIPSKSCRIEGEYFYSEEDELVIQYCRELVLEEYPDYMKDYLVALLAYHISNAYNSYADRKKEIAENVSKQLGIIQTLEGFQSVDQPVEVNKWQ